MGYHPLLLFFIATIGCGSAPDVWAQAPLERADSLFEQLFVIGEPSDERLLIEAKGLWEELACEGHPSAQYYLAFLYFGGLGGAPLDEREALRLLEKAAGSGHAGAQYRLASAYEYGQGYPQSDERAIMWYEEAARSGSWLARERLSTAHAHGELGLTRDPIRAERWRTDVAP